MKLIKKIAAIMFAFMMVFSLSTNAKAEEGTGSTGSIMVSNAVNGQDYTLYKILDLVSYVPGTASTDPDDNGIYSYKPNDNWTEFLDDNTAKGGKPYIKINKDGYADWDGEKTDERRAEFAKKALAWANENHIDSVGKTTASGGKAEFTDLTLGYYLVESSVGALCSLTTTNSNATIIEKNSAPTISKVIDNGKRPTVGNDYNSVSIGDYFSYEIHINVGKGAQKYKLVDTFDKGLNLLNTVTYGKNTGFSITAENYPKTQLEENVDYEVNVDTESHKFTITFLEKCLNNCNENTVISVMYTVQVNEKAKIDEKMLNDAVLEYGTNKKTEHAITETYTHGFKVYKYTTTGGEKGLKGAKFKLYTKSETGEKNYYKFSKSTDGGEYRNSGETGEEILVSPVGGKFNIVGLKEGTYYLEEIEAPEGYNKLSEPVKVEITLNADKSKTVKVDGTVKTDYEAKVLNNTGSLLPSTGGMGTTLIYLVGGALVLGSGFVLANKKRAKAK